jgi:hypothetical protein
MFFNGQFNSNKRRFDYDTKTYLFQNFLLIFTLLFVFNGCTQRLIDYTIISSKQMNMKVNESARGQRVEGKDGIYWLLFIPFGIPNLKEACDEAIESVGSGYDALIDGVVYTEFWWVFFTGYNGYKVQGTPIKSLHIKAALLEQGKDVEVVMKNIIYHSSTGKSNDETIRNIPIIVR